MNIKGNQFLYLQIADRLEKQIIDQVLKAGDKLPSVRMLCREQGLSMSTVTQAYYELESRSLIETRPRSGYFVSLPPVKRLAIPETSNPSVLNSPLSPDDLVNQVYLDREDPNNTLFSLGMPHDDFLPIAKLNKGMVQAMRNLPASGTGYELTQGNENLRREIAKWSFGWAADFTEHDLITTSGCMNAISYALMATTQPGDTIAIESPAYFGILQLAKSMGLQVLELPTNAITGIELEALKKVLATNKIKVCLFVSNFNNPCGSSMPDEHKREAVRLLEHYHIPLIEDDIHGDLYFSKNRPTTCKTYDESGLVLYCNSISKTLAPGYRVGWIAPGQFKDQVLKLKRYQAVSSVSLTSEVVSTFLRNGRYENHLRKLRQSLHHNSMKYSAVIADYFPEGTRVSQPQGGYFLWLELDKNIDTVELYQRALKQQISIAPGRMFSFQSQFDHCMRLSFGLPWTSLLEKKLQQLGKIATNMQKP
ncbi:aminotransferase-like domain-containing protein [Pedobacter caeni]|uniref:DNA-binding transcriptional regulator, MocR family, contains an aminotransferase domain n=1 Tax=Pedobacter caeni TaxID=288992 RepID=A0A1M5AVP9_9SPHI|nr:PLP-dependent aminotransferase family protein [Pedobacter caeni]SHF34329.1 DNA-binding transcriptional regulator, MocR family, contains an aminotransferase domain [Pedobacter caeni]